MLIITLEGNSASRKSVLADSIVKDIRKIYGGVDVVTTERTSRPFPKTLKLLPREKRPDIWIRLFTNNQGE